MKKALKKSIAILCAIAIVTTMFTLAKPMKTEAKVKPIKNFKLKPGVKSMKLTWKKNKKVSYYKIYRYKIKRSEDIEYLDLIEKKKYKKIATTKNKKSYNDKKVKRNKWYAYYINGYKKRKGKDKLIYSTYENKLDPYEYVGLDKPELYNAGCGESNENTINKLYLVAMFDFGATPQKVMVYRKANGEKKYKKIATYKVKKNAYQLEFVDKTVTPGKTYSYKVRSYRKYKKKKYYSKYSQVERISALNLVGKYKVDCLTPAGEVDTFRFKMTGKDKYNGDLTVMPANKDYYYSYTYTEAKNKPFWSYDCHINSYSTDGVTWKAIPQKGVILKGTNSLFFEAKLNIPFNVTTIPKVYFGGDSGCYESYIYSDYLFKYYGSGMWLNYAAGNIDFLKKSATVVDGGD